MRILLYIILFFILYRIVRSILFPKKRVFQQQKNEPNLQGDETILDPICQSYFPKDSALKVKKGSEVVYFCSEECREKFIKNSMQ